MSLRELVSGAGCSAGAGSSNNPLASLTDKILGGGSSKASGEAVRGEQGLQAPQPFLQGAVPSAGDVLHMPFAGGAGAMPLAAAGGAAFLQAFAGPQQAVLSSPLFDSPALAATLHSFIASAKSGEGIAPAPLELPNFSEIEKMKIRERSAALSRQLLGQGPPELAEHHTMQLLRALHIDGAPGQLAAGRDHPFLREFSQDLAARGAPAAGMHASDWANEFAEAPGGQAWAHEFGMAHPRPQWGRPPPLMGPSGAGPDWSQEFLQGGPRPAPEAAADMAARFAGAVSLSEDRVGGDWANEFVIQRGEGSAAGASASGRVVGGAHTRALVETLAANKEPKFQNSKFLQFVSKMSRGDLVFEGGKAVPRGGGGEWAEEFAAARPPAGADAWASEFAQQRGLPPAAMAGPSSSGAAWASEFAEARGGAGGMWADEFAGAAAEWTDEFTRIHGEEAGEDWAEAYEQFLASVHDRDAVGPAARGEYDFVEDNPYLTHADPLSEGQALFRSGVLSEAVLALEAAVRRDEGNSEAWRLLGTVHAENDDDRRAIAAMSRALRADPDNLEVLLSLSVSHTNELDTDEALGYMSSWLGKHPRYAAAAAAAAAEAEAAARGEEAAQGGAAGLMERFRRAAALHPGDADVHAVIGVLCNLLRQYDDAVVAFERALEINPGDYSLWNKLGATLANSARSGEALGAYRRALDLKPNYVRAWTNMGIGYANQGEYAQSAGYYVRALSLNPRADSVWGYLRMSLSCLGQADLFPALDAHNLAPLQARFAL